MASQTSHYRLPLSALEQVLGVASPPAGGDKGFFQRRWQCGCSARYRYTIHQTAVWRPCALHGARPAESSEPVPARIAPTIAVEIAGRRRGPTFCIVDRELNVIYASPHTDAAALVECARDVISGQAPLEEPAIVPFEEQSLLRIVPVTGAWTSAYALFVEDLSSRGSFQSAALRFGFTPRELDVLRLIVAGQSNSEIARTLCIAESTAADHVKSMFRKARCSKRTELLVTFFQA